MKKTELYCHDKELNKHDGKYYYNDFYPSEIQVGMCGAGKIIRILVREALSDEESPYYAWWDNESQSFDMIFPSKVQVQMCFPYGYKVEEEKGTGKLFNVVVEPLGNIKNV